MSDTPKENETKETISGPSRLFAPPAKVSTHNPDEPEKTMAIDAIRRARMYESAMASLIENQSENHIPIAHLAGFAIELGLKAYLLRNGHSEAEVKQISHDLKKAWNKAHSSGLRISVAWPDWFDRLDCLHRLMLLRYPHRTIAGLVLPDQANYQQGIAEILSRVETSMGD